MCRENDGGDRCCTGTDGQDHDFYCADGATSQYEGRHCNEGGWGIHYGRTYKCCKVNEGAIIGVIVGCIVGGLCCCGIIAAVVVMFMRRSATVVVNQNTVPAPVPQPGVQMMPQPGVPVQGMAPTAPRFDPETGRPSQKFDPYTGKPLPRFDPTTGLPNY